ncbi:hypothetical protein FJZ17_03820 [Candidatus Pacearchaeota archaeon]|nr:hypothetical protein [Candidatus Pacearchaeota archaeon]
MKKSLFIVICALILFLIIGFLAYNFFQGQERIKEKSLVNCLQEGNVVGTMPLSGEISNNLSCCVGLKPYYAMDVMVCGNCGDGICKTYGNNYTKFEESSPLYCPEDCD